MIFSQKGKLPRVGGGRTAPCFARSARALSADRSDQFYISVSPANYKNCSGLHNTASTSHFYHFIWQVQVHVQYFLYRPSKQVLTPAVQCACHWYLCKHVLISCQLVAINLHFRTLDGWRNCFWRDHPHSTNTGSAKEILKSIYTVVKNMYVDTLRRQKTDKSTYVQYI